MITETEIEKMIKRLEEQYVGAIYAKKGFFIAYDLNCYDLYEINSCVASFRSYDEIIKRIAIS